MEMTHDFGNVVSFARKPAAMNFPAVAQVDAYWEGLRNGRLMPDRAEVDPRGLNRALEFAFMLESVEPGAARIRIAGMHLNDLLGMEVRGMPISALFEPSARERVGRILTRVQTRAEVADLLLSSSRGIARAPLTARLYLAPLSSAGQNTTRILGCLQSDGSIGRTPRRFRVEQAQMRRIVASARDDRPDDIAVAPVAALPELAEDAAEFSHARKRAGIPHLRLVMGEKQDV